MALIMTAVKHGATVANYTELTDLKKDKDGKITGAEVVDVLSGEKIAVKAKVSRFFASFRLSPLTISFSTGCYQFHGSILRRASRFRKPQGPQADCRSVLGRSYHPA